MGVKFEGKSYAGNMPVFWRGEAKISSDLRFLYPNMQKSYLAEQTQNRESLKELYFRLMIS